MCIRDRAKAAASAGAAARDAHAFSAAAAVHAARAAARSALAFIHASVARAARFTAAAAAAQAADHAADSSKRAQQAASDARVAETVRTAVLDTVQDMVTTVASEPFKTCFDFDNLPVKKLKYIVQQLKGKVDAPPPATHKGKAPMVHWLQQSPEKQLRNVVVSALPMQQLQSFVDEHFPHAVRKADLM